MFPCVIFPSKTSTLVSKDTRMIEDSWRLTQLREMILPWWVSAKHGQHYWDARSILGKMTRQRLPFFQSDTLNRKGKIQLPCASKYQQLPVKTVDLFTEIYIQGPSKTLPIELGTMQSICERLRPLTQHLIHKSAAGCQLPWGADLSVIQDLTTTKHGRMCYELPILEKWVHQDLC